MIFVLAHSQGSEGLGFGRSFDLNRLSLGQFLNPNAFRPAIISGGMSGCVGAVIILGICLPDDWASKGVVLPGSIPMRSIPIRIVRALHSDIEIGGGAIIGGFGCPPNRSQGFRSRPWQT